MFCLLCRDNCDESQCRRPTAKAALLLMLCLMLDKKKLTISEAQYLYKEIHLRKRICKKHFHEVAIFIGEVVSKVCKTTVHDLFTVPGYAVEEVIAHFDSYRSAIDADVVFTPYYVATFHRDHINMDLACIAPPRKRKQPRQMKMSWMDASTSTEDLEEQMTIPSDSTMNLRHILEFDELDETDPTLLDEHFLIQGSQLLELFRFCPSCGTKISESIRCVSLTAVGKTPIVHYICTACSPYEKRFEGLIQGASSSREVSPGTPQSVTPTITKETLFLNAKQEVITDDNGSAPLDIAFNEPESEEANSLFHGKRIKEEVSSSLMGSACGIGTVDEIVDLALKQSESKEVNSFFHGQRVEVPDFEAVPVNHNCDVRPASALQQPSPEYENDSSCSVPCEDATGSQSAESGIKGESLLGC